MMDNGRIGVWYPLFGRAPAAVVREAAAELEELGYSTLWVNETSTSREPFAGAALLLAATRQIAVGTGVANIWARDATAMAAGRATLGEAYPGRFLLGIGVSHGGLVAGRGHDYGKPLTAMRAYLDGMDQAATAMVAGGEAPTLLAALRPRMLELARDRAEGAHTYFVPPEHTALARESLGKDRLLVPELAVVLEPDPAKARQVAREHMAYYLGLPNYVNNLRDLGYTDSDFADGGSDRLADAIVAWGDEQAVAKRVRAHLDAGADHVALQPLTAGGHDMADGMAQLSRLSDTLDL
ncbi:MULTISPECIES: TIGR03620 family F420-dependent LLM class oxidoreductase [Nonomuraea]|uniref:TIGR03620 family F420-dependent LLM class oxidoreductase n=1 Tax=Nonomuraea mangrovi TaxID=2316207 RepID=A0ABW4SSK8_9ACTN